MQYLIFPKRCHMPTDIISIHDYVIQLSVTANNFHFAVFNRRNNIWVGS